MKDIGSIVISLSGTTLLPRERALLEHPSVGMVVLFRENWDKNSENPKENLKKLVREIRHINPKIITAVDHEGGRVWLNLQKNYDLWKAEHKRKALAQKILPLDKAS